MVYHPVDICGVCAGYVAGSAGAVGENVLPMDSANSAAETPIEGCDEEVGTTNASPQLEESQILSSGEVTAIASQYSMDSLRERAQLAARAATAASDAAQRAAAYSAAASSASSAAVAAAERAAVAAGSAQIAVESCAEEAILEVGTWLPTCIFHSQWWRGNNVPEQKSCSRDPSQQAMCSPLLTYPWCLEHVQQVRWQAERFQPKGWRLEIVDN